jgi:hypothetical protein
MMTLKAYQNAMDEIHTLRARVKFLEQVVGEKECEHEAAKAELKLAWETNSEKELRGLRLLQMGDAYPDPELRKLLRDGLGVDLDEGTVR